MRFAEVAVDAPAGPGRTFSYSRPPSLELRLGHLVLVPFGPRRLQGIVFALSDQPQVPETRDVEDIVFDAPVLSATQLRLSRWIAGYYQCGLFEAAAPMLPPGGRVRQRVYLTSGIGGAEVATPSLSPFQQKVLAYVVRRKQVSEDRVLQVMGRGAGSAIKRLVDSGQVVRSRGRSAPTVSPKYRNYVALSPAGSHEALRDLPKLAKRAPRQAALLSKLGMESTPLLQAAVLNDFGSSAVNGLLDRGWLTKRRVAVDRDPLEGRDFPLAEPITLTALQQRAASEVRRALAGRSVTPRAFLLQGVTGSGKTEVYLDATQHCLAMGKRAIVMVPEIALTHQTIERFASRFPGNVAVLHSGLTSGQRFDQWWKARRGQYGIVIGSRSAVFAPQPDLGLIILDEEHEWAYKQQESSPRYHAREVALKLAQLTGSVVLLGSASPDVASYRAAMGKSVGLLRLPDRVAPDGPGGPRGASQRMAAVNVVDMRRELREGNSGMFSGVLERATAECLDAGSQAILFLNRRGSASHMQCRSCGFGLRCRRCDVSVSYHGDLRRLLCHYCGDRRIPPDRCPKCLSYGLSYYGVGTQAVAGEVRRQFPGAKVIRWDRDSARTPAEHQDLLERFRSGDAQVLVGTQMIAKGLHFPSVTLVGVILADVGMHLPDYRAGERTFQLLCQVVGRSGRGRSAGTAIIQTYQPGNYAIRAAATQDYQQFYPTEIAHRREQGNPPFSRLIRLLHTHTNRALCERRALRMVSLLSEERESWGMSDVELLGPTPAHPPRLRGRYRWQIILRGAQPRALLEKVAIPASWTIDVDPVGLS